MSHHDPDLAAVRELAAAVHGPSTEPSPDVVARTWSRVSTQTRPRVRRRWLALPAAAGGVAVVVVGASLLLRPTASPDAGAPKPPPAPPPTSAPPATPVPPPDLGTVVRPLPVATVVSTMVQRAATVQPLAIPAGKLLYVGSTADGVVNHEMWLDPQGMVALKIGRDGVDMGPGDRLAGGPSLRNPTPQWLADLSTNPRTLLTMLKALNSGNWLHPTHYVLKELWELYWKCGPVLTPTVRAAFYKVFLELDGLSAVELRINGRTMYEIRRPTDRGADAFLLDPGTGQVVGSRLLTVGPSNTFEATGVGLYRHVVVDGVGETS